MRPPTRNHRHALSGDRVVAAKAADVWAVLSDFHAVNEWAPRVRRVVPLSDTPRGRGMARYCEIRGLGSVEEVVNVWEEERRLGYSVTPLGPIGASQSLWEIEEVDAESVRVRLGLYYDMRFGFLGTLLHALLVRRLLEKNLPGALALLKRKVESNRAIVGYSERNDD